MIRIEGSERLICLLAEGLSFGSLNIVNRLWHSRSKIVYNGTIQERVTRGKQLIIHWRCIHFAKILLSFNQRHLTVNSFYNYDSFRLKGFMLLIRVTISWILHQNFCWFIIHELWNVEIFHTRSIRIILSYWFILIELCCKRVIILVRIFIIFENSILEKVIQSFFASIQTPDFVRVLTL